MPIRWKSHPCCRAIPTERCAFFAAFVLLFLGALLLMSLVTIALAELGKKP